MKFKKLSPRRTPIVLSLFFLLAGFIAGGCAGQRDSLSDAALEREIGAALEKAGEIRMSNTDHPWEVMHGIYLFGTGYEITDSKTGLKMNALDNVCCMETARKFIQVDGGGPLFVSEVGEAEADTHRNMFLSILSVAGVPLYHAFHGFDGNIYPLWRFLDKAMLEIVPDVIKAEDEVVEGNYGNELGWTLSAFTKYLPLDHRWKNRKGEWIEVEDILAIAIKRPYGWGTCFGTHELYGIAVAVERWEEGGGEIEGVWADAREYLDGAAQLVKENMNEDGSLSYEWHREKKSPGNARKSVYATGHTLEWLVPALERTELREEWVRRIVSNVADTIINDFDKFDDAHSISTHAAHGLKTYRKKALEEKQVRTPD